MSTVVYSNSQPEQIQYMPLPNSTKADVRLHRNIEEVTDEEGSTYWQAEEVYFRATITLEEVTEKFDTLFENDGPEMSLEDAETEEDKYTVLQNQIAELKSEICTVAEAVSTVASEDVKATLKEAIPFEGVI